MDKDITESVQFRNNDGEFLPLTECVCGAEFIAWDFVLSVYEDRAMACPNCNRRMYFRFNITVYEVVDNDNQPLPDAV